MSVEACYQKGDTSVAKKKAKKKAKKAELTVTDLSAAAKKKAKKKAKKSKKR